MDKKDEVMPGFLPLELENSPEGDEFIPLMTNEDEESLSAKKIPDALPILPLRNTVLFPGVVIPITVGRDKSIRLIRGIENHSFLVNFISSNMNADVSLKQRLLEIPDLRERANLVLEHLTKELQMIELKNKIQTKVRSDIDKQQREYFLSQQLKTIQ